MDRREFEDALQGERDRAMARRVAEMEAAAVAAQNFRGRLLAWSVPVVLALMAADGLAADGLIGLLGSWVLLPLAGLGYVLAAFSFHQVVGCFGARGGNVFAVWALAGLVAAFFVLGGGAGFSGCAAFVYAWFWGAPFLAVAASVSPKIGG